MASLFWVFFPLLVVLLLIGLWVFVRLLLKFSMCFKWFWGGNQLCYMGFYLWVFLVLVVSLLIRVWVFYKLFVDG